MDFIIDLDDDHTVEAWSLDDFSDLVADRFAVAET